MDNWTKKEEEIVIQIHHALAMGLRTVCTTMTYSGSLRSLPLFSEVKASTGGYF